MTSRTFQRTLLSAATALAFEPAPAAEDEIAQYTRPDSSISVGIGHWSNDRPRLGIYDGMRDEGAYGLFDADVIQRDDASATWLMFNARNLGLDTREIRLDALRQGDIGAYVEYSRIPRDNPLLFTTGLQGIGTPQLTHGTVQGGTFPRGEVTLGTDRELLRLGGFKNLMPGLDLKIDFKNEEKTGSRHWGWGSSPLFSVEPLDSTTRQLEAVLQYSSERFQLAGGYYGSWYHNDHAAVFQRLNGISGGTASFGALTPMSLPLDNYAHQLSLDGDYSFGPTTQGTFKLAYTRATQDEQLPTFAAPNNPFAGTPSNLNGRIDTKTFQLGLTSRPLPRLSLAASLRHHDQDDKTPVAQFVQTVSAGSTTRVFNTPHSFKTTTGKVEATYRLPRGFSLTGGIDYSKQERSIPAPSSTLTTAAGVTTSTLYVPFRTDLDEITYRLQLRRSLTEDLNGTLSFLHGDRDGTSYVEANGTAPFSNQINPFHIADRKRDRWRLTLDWAPLEQLSLQFRAEESRDRYPDDGRPYGLKRGTANLYAIDVNYAISDVWKLSAWYAYDRTKAREISVRAPQGSTVADAIKETHTKEEGDSLGLDVRGQFGGRLEFGAGVEWFSNVSSYPQDIQLQGAVPAFPAGMSPLPEIKSDLTRLKLSGRYALDKASSLQLDLIHERWHADDWTWRFSDGQSFSYFSGLITCAACVPANPIVVDGTTTYDRRTQTANFIGLRYIYRFQ